MKVFGVALFYWWLECQVETFQGRLVVCVVSVDLSSQVQPTPAQVECVQLSTPHQT